MSLPSSRSESPFSSDLLEVSENNGHLNSVSWYTARHSRVYPPLEQVTFDDQYLARLRARDKEAVDQFYQSFYLPIRNFMRMRFRWEDADDLTQQVFLAALEKIDSGAPRDAKKLPGYITGISKYISRQHTRHIGHDRLAETDFDFSRLSGTEASTEASLITKQLVRVMSNIVEQLPSREREALRRELQGQPREEIAKALGVNVSNLRLIIYRAWDHVRLEWKKTAK